MGLDKMCLLKWMVAHYKIDLGTLIVQHVCCSFMTNPQTVTGCWPYKAVAYILYISMHWFLRNVQMSFCIVKLILEFSYLRNWWLQVFPTSGLLYCFHQLCTGTVQITTLQLSSLYTILIVDSFVFESRREDTMYVAGRLKWGCWEQCAVPRTGMGMNVNLSDSESLIKCGTSRCVIPGLGFNLIIG